MSTTTVPLLPCRRLDDVVGFYGSMGFAVSYRQERPNPYVVLQREDLALHFFGMPTFDPADSYGSCIVGTDDADGLYAAFCAGLKEATGKVPRSGIPRVTRPRKKRDQVTGFSVVDPGGNWIRVAQVDDEPDEAPTTPLGRVLHTAIALGDSKGDLRAASRTLDAGLRKITDPDPTELRRALVYRAELAIAMDDMEAARTAVARARLVGGTTDDDRLAELEAELG